MKTTATIASLFPVVRARLTQIQLDVESQPQSWHDLLQKAIDNGAFLKIELGYGLGGLVECELNLVGKKGEICRVSIAGASHV